jgi:hypothetical protein
VNRQEHHEEGVGSGRAGCQNVAHAADQRRLTASNGQHDRRTSAFVLMSEQEPFYLFITIVLAYGTTTETSAVSRNVG